MILHTNFQYADKINRSHKKYMGMFDIIDYECKCPVCDNTVTGFQSKDGECLLLHLIPEEVDNFYSGCDVCKTWITFSRIKIKNNIKNKYKTRKTRFVMTTEPNIEELKSMTNEDIMKNIDSDDYRLREYCRYKLMPLKEK